MYEGEVSYSFERAPFQCGAHEFKTLEDALNCGLMFHRQGDYSAAADIYDCIISKVAVCPEVCYYRALLHGASDEHDRAVDLYQKIIAAGESPPFVYYDMGLSYYSLGNFAEAATCFLQAVDLDGNHFAAWYNLGLTYQKTGSFYEALVSYRRALELSTEDFDALFNFALVLKQLGRVSEAVQYFKKALGVMPDDHEAYYNLGLCYKDLHEFDNAVFSLRKSLQTKADFAPALNNLGVLLAETGATDEAVQCFRRCIELGHKVSSAKHMVAALTGETTKRPPQEYVKRLFDNFSESFEDLLLNKLKYNVPRLMRELFDSHGADAGNYCETLDLGCGTGLSGEVFRDISSYLCGVDLSPQMIQRAEEKGIYDALDVSDVVHYLENTTQSFDLVVAADVFVYMGELSELFEMISRRLRQRGYCIFSTELSDRDFELQETGRYAHSISYIERCLAQHSLAINIQHSADIRQEKGEWIKGVLFIVQKM